ncbi:hypothetical protein EPIR_3167 [Erwinia piriflorinigrans CFBP 5888]|uniref:Uncharacterized protein n=2 Tax=Erwinia piriflorinigrans TaxID=665097 RepID=V5ZBB0_9GAMM|nr:hypothetical protein EPIR_3167 [Erwinia piriflorinigrans CFBP 5888]
MCVIRTVREVIDYGVLSRWQLQETSRAGELTPGARTLPVTVACPYAQSFRLRIDGTSSVAGQVRYGRSGWLKLQASNLRVDGMFSGMTVASPDKGSRSVSVGNAALEDGSVIIPNNGGQAVTGRTVTFDLVIEPRLAEKDNRVTVPLESEAGLRITLE